MDTPKPEVIFVLGGPGAGKGTQCNKLVDTYGLVHLSAGDLLRAERDTGSEDAELINNYIKEGKIVPVEITCHLIKKAMEKHGWEKCKYLVDGFPRNEDNLDGWNKVSAFFMKKLLRELMCYLGDGRHCGGEPSAVHEYN